MLCISVFVLHMSDTIYSVLNCDNICDVPVSIYNFALYVKIVFWDCDSRTCIKLKHMCFTLFLFICIHNTFLCTTPTYTNMHSQKKKKKKWECIKERKKKRKLCPLCLFVQLPVHCFVGRQIDAVGKLYQNWSMIYCY